ncbi:hypothetical protein HanHA300_Chr02g0064991 [Helianthus annuus]|nr:hypothetical protein HanHA300_Chr02g0064991 [Helianthus annuus]KAJ0619632.1 hypothetical protein HanHA89_Chr02g0073451 [Helianthus annuus]
MQLQLILNKGLKEPFLLHGPKNYVTREMEDHSGGLLFLKLLVVLITITLKKFMSLMRTKYMMECLWCWFRLLLLEPGFGFDLS